MLTIKRFILAVVLSSTVTGYAADVSITIDPYLVEEKNFLGFGANWGDYTDRVITDTQWNRLRERLQFMKPGMLRIMSLSYTRIGTKDSVTEKFSLGPDTNLQRVKNNIRMLEITRDLNIPVGIGWWAITSTDSSYVNMYADYFDSLINKARYSNLKIFYPQNEPGWGSLSTWSDFTRKMYTAFTARNLPIKITGPDTYINRPDTTSYGYTNTRICMNTCLAYHTSHLGYYDLHTYLDPIPRNVFRGYLNEIINRDPNGIDKNFFIGEYAPSDISWDVWSFKYGVAMTRQQASYSRVGISGIAKWSLDDDSWETTTVKRHGFWSTVSDPTIRPAFYSWSLSCRLFPPGCQTLILPETKTPKLDIYAAKIADGDASDVSITIVNDTTIARTLIVKLPKTASLVSLVKYHYFDTDRPVDSNGYSKAKDTLRSVDLAQGIEISLPSRGVVFLTTMYLDSNSISFKEDLSMEAESIAVAASGVVLDTIKESSASSDQWVILSNGSASGYCDFSVNVENAGTYFIGVRAKAAKRHGIYTLSVDGQPMSGEVDLFTTDSSIFVTTDHGSAVLSAGVHLFRVAISGKNDLSEGYAVGIDRMIVAENRDEIVVDGGTGGGTAIELSVDNSFPIIKSSVSPNPFNPSTSIRYSIPKNKLHYVSVYSLNGTLVRTLFLGMNSSGTNTIVWNGCDDAGKEMSSGVYLIRIMAGTASQYHKVMLIK
jgi:hypothetical protein